MVPSSQGSQVPYRALLLIWVGKRYILQLPDGVCDRIAIINEGKVAGILPPTADILEFGKMMVGVLKEGNNE